MIQTITITVQPAEEKNEKLINSLVRKELKIRNVNFSAADLTLVLEKKSIDARHGRQKILLKYKVFIGEKPEDLNKLPEWKKADISENGKKVIIVGAGPAGLFGALKLLEYGIKPIIIDRGAETSQRKKDIAEISRNDLVNENSNYCFGEGGAGTFSDGKLYTRSNKRGDIGTILKIFSEFGANPKILTDAHPHIGTDRLPTVINNMRAKIIELGGEFHFNTKVTGFVTEKKAIELKGGAILPNTGKNESIKVLGVEVEKVNGGQTSENLTGDITGGQTSKILADAVLLATGHSASDIYSLIARTNPASLEAKTFAAGVRVEHPRTLIDSIQYHGKLDKNLPTAEYRVTTQVEDRGVYSFCMCPGGFVVPSATGPDEIVVNGMSTAARNSKWSNAAIVVEIRPEDVPEKFRKQAAEENCEALAGLYFRTDIEKSAKSNGNGQAAPAQRLTDFIDNRLSANLPETSYTPGIVSSNLNQWLPKHIARRLKIGFENINRSMKGFICNDALMIAAETRTSTPVRILRNKETYECEGLRNLYPAGEGSGYSGGIVSSAMDGENACKIIAEKLLKN